MSLPFPSPSLCPICNLPTLPCLDVQLNSDISRSKCSHSSSRVRDRSSQIGLWSILCCHVAFASTLNATEVPRIVRFTSSSGLAGNAKDRNIMSLVLEVSWMFVSIVLLLMNFVRCHARHATTIWPILFRSSQSCIPYPVFNFYYFT